MEQQNEGDKNKKNRRVIDYLLPPSGQYLLVPNALSDDPGVSYEINPMLIAMLQKNQFGGNGEEGENPYEHLTRFGKLCQSVNIAGIPRGKLLLYLFSFSLKDRALVWLETQAPENITTWDQMARRFITMFYSPLKVTKFMEEIAVFKQRSDESVIGAWTRMKGLLRKGPAHEFPDRILFQAFFRGITNANSRRWLNESASGGSFMAIAPEEARKLLENVPAENEELWEDRWATTTNWPTN